MYSVAARHTRNRSTMYSRLFHIRITSLCGKCQPPTVFGSALLLAEQFHDSRNDEKCQKIISESGIFIIHTGSGGEDSPCRRFLFDDA